MPPIGYPGNAITKEARAKAGGGFESAMGSAPDPAPTGGTPLERQFSVKIDAVGGTPGVRASDPSGIVEGKHAFTGDAGGTTYTDEFQIDGQNTLRLSVNQGTTGFGTFGGTLDYLPHPAVGVTLKRGDEFWVRCKIHFPSASFVFQQRNHKFLRNRVTSPDGTTNGYLDTYLNPNQDRWDSQVAWIYEGLDQWVISSGGQNPIWTGFQYDTTHTYEMYVRLDHIDVANGGIPLQRVWVDGVLRLEDTKRTMVTADDYQHEAKLFTYYGNELAPTDLWCYVKDYIVQSSVPSKTDSFGNPFIGLDV